MNDLQKLAEETEEQIYTYVEGHYSRQHVRGLIHSALEQAEQSGYKSGMRYGWNEGRIHECKCQPQPRGKL